MAHAELVSLAATRRIGVHVGPEPGPTVLCTAAVHGNEYAGVLALRRLFDRLEIARPPAFRGRLVGLVGNLGALNDPDPDCRYLETDLNRLGTLENLLRIRSTPRAALGAEMRELAELQDEFEAELERAKGPVYHMDLHTVSSGSPPFAGVIDSPPARHLSARLPIPVILGIDRHLEGLLVSLTASRYGMTSLVVEGGQHDDPGSVDRHEAAVRIVLGAAGVLPPGTLGWERDTVAVLTAAVGALMYRAFEIIHREPIHDDAFSMLPEAVAYAPVTAGETPVAISGGRVVLAAATGLLFMPNRQRRPHPGDDAYFVIREVPHHSGT